MKVRVQISTKLCSNYRLYHVPIAATSQLLKLVNTELKLEQNSVADLPNGFTSFELTTDGSMATLLRQHDQEKVKVQLDANSAIEAASDDVEFEEEEGKLPEDELEVDLKGCK